MGTVDITTHISVTLGGVVKEYGSKTLPVEFTITNGHIYEARGQVDDDYTADVLWVTGDGDFDAFEFLYFISDADVLLELRNDAATDEFLLFEVKANIPLILTGDGCRGRDDGTTPIGDGAGSGTITTLNDVDQITVQRNVADDAGDATVLLVLMN